MRKVPELVSARHIFPSSEVKNRWALASSQMTQKSSHASMLSGFLLKSGVRADHDFGSAMSVVVANAG